MSATDTARAAYRGAAGRAYQEGKRALPPVAVPWVTRARAELFQPHVRPEDAVFEFGCGYGWNLGALRCRRRVGHDVADSVRTEVIATGTEFAADTATLPEAAFEVILCHHALEHVPDPLAVLAELGRLLKPGGRLLLAVPYESERRYRRFDPAEPNHHLYAWNVQTLGNLVTVAGFQLRDAGLRRYGYDRFAAKLAVRFRLGERGFRLFRAVGQTLRPLREVVVTAER
ncbi:MAG TPA: class I SAM-dependent methyltransferase [Candidatus Limnocylindria bacterium]|nr:class I SAM-dependent methyltransferase [Candidatus Limnocylindria bacterium]